MKDAIAIDGPAGAGKSTIAKMVAAELEMIYVDTGAMYRAIALWTAKEKISADDVSSIENKLDNVNVTIDYKDGQQRVLLNGKDVTDSLRTEETGRRASVVSRHKCVREKLVSLQQDLAESKRVIMDGRDIGTKVLPDAVLKIFLTASAEVRAERRFKELQEKGIECDYDIILEDIKARDHADETRKESPLKPAEDSVDIDSSDMTQEEVAEEIIRLYNEVITCRK